MMSYFVYLASEGGESYRSSSNSVGEVYPVKLRILSFLSKIFSGWDPNNDGILIVVADVVGLCGS